MKFFKKTLIASALTAASFGALSTASAATLQTDVDINFPQILVLFAFDEVTVNVEDAFVQTLFDSPACTVVGVLNDCATNLTTAKTVAATSGTVDLDIASDTDTDITSSTASFTLENSFGVRSLGVTTYTATVTKASGDAGLTVASNTTPATPGFALSTGDIVLDVDLADASVADGAASAILQIEVTGT